MIGLNMQEASIRKVAACSLLLNLVLVGTKLFLSIATNSLALRADAVHSLVDVFGSIALILGLIISNRKSESFPYGLYKVENIVSVIISLLLFITAYEIAVEAIKGNPTAFSYEGWALAAVAALIPVPLLFGSYEARMGKKVNSPSLITDGSQFKADVLISSLVFLALLGQRFGLPLDRIAAIIIAIFVVKAGWGILVNGMRVLLDASVDTLTLEKIRATIEAEPAVSAIKAVTARNSGRYLFVEVNVSLRIIDLKRAHQASERMEKAIRETVPHVDRVLIHYEPQIRTKIRYVVPLTNAIGEISIHFGASPFFGLIEIDLGRKAVFRQEVIANPYKDLTKGRGLKVAEFLLGHKPDVILTRESLTEKGPGYAFAEAGVETVQIEVESLEKTVEDLLAQLKNDSAN